MADDSLGAELTKQQIKGLYIELRELSESDLPKNVMIRLGT